MSFYKLAELNIKAMIDSWLRQWISVKTVKWKTPWQISLSQRNSAQWTYHTDICIISINLSGALHTLLDWYSAMELAWDKEVPAKDGVSISGREWFAFSKCTSRFKGIWNGHVDGNQMWQRVTWTQDGLWNRIWNSVLWNGHVETQTMQTADCADWVLFFYL